MAKIAKIKLTAEEKVRAKNLKTMQKVLQKRRKAAERAKLKVEKARIKAEQKLLKLLEADNGGEVGAGTFNVDNGWDSMEGVDARNFLRGHGNTW